LSKRVLVRQERKSVITRDKRNDMKTDTGQTDLPPEYVELEKRVDALKEAHQRILKVTCVYKKQIVLFVRAADNSS